MRSATRLWLPGLAAVVTALIATPAQAAGTEQQPAASPAIQPLPAASWHGRPIRRPENDGALVAQTVVAGQAPLKTGAGYGRPGGSQDVRDIQRLLRRIGYRPGPVDGKFGPLTRSSVQWFQIKHGLGPTGTVGAVELSLLRLRAAGKSPVRARGVRLHTAAPAVVPQVAPEPSPAGADGGVPALAVLGAVGVFALFAIGGLLFVRRARAGRLRIPVPRARAGSSGSAVGYLRRNDQQGEKQRARAIRQACAERGWAVSQIVREGRVNGADAHERPGLAFAFEELRRRHGGRLVISRLDDVGRTRRELATVLEWCTRSGVDLVALDVGLDTGTQAGRLAARCLVAVGDGRRRRPRQSERARVTT
jgi:peptidoglycan hydrolase-like protein with peptidoglycan-binding domain